MLLNCINYRSNNERANLFHCFDTVSRMYINNQPKRKLKGHFCENDINFCSVLIISINIDARIPGITSLEFNLSLPKMQCTISRYFKIILIFLSFNRNMVIKWIIKNKYRSVTFF